MGLMFDYDLVVVGSGGGTFGGAIRARDLGKRVLMVDRGTIGGHVREHRLHSFEGAAGAL